MKNIVKTIILGVLFWISIFFVVYANIKANQAEKQTIQAELMLELAKENERKAIEEEQKILIALTKAKEEISQLRSELKNCK